VNAAQKELNCLQQPMAQLLDMKTIAKIMIVCIQSKATMT